MADRPADGVVRAAGAVLWRPAGDGVEVAVVHRPKYDDWSLPKGKLDAGELAVVAAAREVWEETGFRGVVGRALGTTRYTVAQDGHEVPKTVRWWAMRAVEGAFVPGDEVDDLQWLPPERALEAVTLGRDSQPLRRFLAGPPGTRTLLLLRHGCAGSRGDWPGDDDERPLDDTGRAQAEAACLVLPLYRPERLVSAPLRRCTETLRPLAELTGLPVELDRALTARSWGEDPDGTARDLLDLVAHGRTTVACTQGEVLPNVVGRLADRSGLQLGELHADKGSLWALSFDDGGRLVDADYTPSLLA